MDQQNCIPLRERQQHVTCAAPNQEARGGQQEPKVHAVEQAIIFSVKHGVSFQQNPTSIRTVSVLGPHADPELL